MSAFLESSKTEGGVHRFSLLKPSQLSKEASSSTSDQMYRKYQVFYTGGWGQSSPSPGNDFADLLCLLYDLRPLKTVREEGYLGQRTIKELLDPLAVMPS